MVKKGFLHDKGTPFSNLINRHDLTDLIFPDSEKHLAKTFVCLSLCLTNMSLKQYGIMSFCLKSLFFCLKTYVPLS